MRILESSFKLPSTVNTVTDVSGLQLTFPDDETDPSSSLSAAESGHGELQRSVCNSPSQVQEVCKICEFVHVTGADSERLVFRPIGRALSTGGDAF